MNARARRLAVLAAAMAADRAERLLAAMSGPGVEGVAAHAAGLATRPRFERLAALAEAFTAGAASPGLAAASPLLRRLARELSARGARDGPHAALRASAPGSAARPARRPGTRAGGRSRARSAAGTVRESTTPRMALPLRLPRISTGFTALTPAAREVGRALAEATGAALAGALSLTGRISATPTPAVAGPARGMARVAVPLEGIPATAVLEVEVLFLARVLQRMAGRATPTPAALTETQAERALLDLAALVAVDAARGVAPLARLQPRVAMTEELDPEALALALEVSLGPERGRGRLLVPEAALRALSASPRPDLPAAIAELEVAASFTEGTISLTREELGAASSGDVLLLDEGARACSAVLPGGLALRGRLEGGSFHVQEIRMTETQASYPLTLTVEIARVVITLGELSRLEPGGAIPLDVRRDGAVVLRAGERAIARGQLVEIGGALGVRIAELGERA